jgi:hypothetical protein
MFVFKHSKAGTELTTDGILTGYLCRYSLTHGYVIPTGAILTYLVVDNYGSGAEESLL